MQASGDFLRKTASWRVALVWRVDFCWRDAMVLNEVLSTSNDNARLGQGDEGGEKTERVKIGFSDRTSL